jgi:D-aspartate ligase
MNASVPAFVLQLYHGGLAVARSLGRLGVEVHGVAADRRRPGVRSRYLRETYFWDIDTTPARDTVDWLLEVGRRVGGRPLLVATEDVGAMLVADYADELREAFRFPEQPAGLARRLSSKDGMQDLCHEHSIPTPFAIAPRSRAEVERFVASTTFPVVLKGIDAGRFQQDAGIRVIVVDEEQELWRMWDQASANGEPNLLLQEYIPGGPDSVWMFNGYFNGDSDCLIGITGQKLRQFPPYTGFTSLGICRDNETVRETTSDLMKKLGYRGVLDLGYRYDARDGLYKLLDVNPRVGSTFRLFVSSTGHDVVRALYLDLTDQEPEAVGRAVPGRKWLIENLDLASSATYFRNGELRPRAWLRSYTGVKETAWFARDDPAPFVAMVVDSVRRAVKAVGRRATA